MTTAAAALEPPVPMPLVWRFADSGLVSAFAMLLVFPYAVVELSATGRSAAAVGLFALLKPAAMVVLIPLLPRLNARFGRVVAVRLGLAAGAIAVSGFALTEAYVVWLMLAGLAGVQLAIHWTTVDVVLSENVPKHRAGAIIGLYQTLLASVVAAGPGVVALTDVPFAVAAQAGLLLFAIAAMLTVGAVARYIDGGARDAHRRPGGLARFVGLNLPLAAGAILAGLFEVGTTAMASVHALHLGFAAAAAVMVVSVIAIGSLVAQVPIGWLADRFSVPLMMRVAGLILLASALVLPLAATVPWLLWPLAAAWGAFGGGLQTLVYMRIAVTKTGPEVQLGMMTMALGFTFGSLIGPALGGLAADLSPAYGLATMLGLMATALLVVVRRT